MHRILLARALTGWVALVVYAAPALAAGAGKCDDYSAAALKAAEQVRKLGCGFNLSNPRWSTDPNVHRRWCRQSKDESVDQEDFTRRDQLAECQMCRAYSDLAMAAVRDNIKYRCGFVGPRWVNNPAAHFNWCMSLADTEQSGLFSFYRTNSEKKRENLDPETGARSQAIAECKLTHEPVQARCMNCHNESRTSVLSRTKPSNARVVPSSATEGATMTKRRATNSGGDPCGAAIEGQPCQPSHRVFGPGLLDGDQAIGRSGPAGAGTPIHDGGGSRSPQLR